MEARLSIMFVLLATVIAYMRIPFKDREAYTEVNVAAALLFIFTVITTVFAILTQILNWTYRIDVAYCLYGVGLIAFNTPDMYRYARGDHPKDVKAARSWAFGWVFVIFYCIMQHLY